MCPSARSRAVVCSLLAFPRLSRERRPLSTTWDEVLAKDRLDLNQRPLGYEGNSGHHSNQDEPTRTNYDEDLLNGAVGDSWLISVALLHSRFIGFDRQTR